MAALRARRHLSTWAVPRDNRPTRVGRRPGSGSLTHADKPWIATPAMS
jgi:hypothetical protein